MAESLSSGQREISPLHDFTSKLLQPGVIDVLKSYVRWQVERRRSPIHGINSIVDPNIVPVSINLDLTTRCNYACDHCVDYDILNDPYNKFDHDVLMRSLSEMSERGLKSVIVIGGGEPTIYPKFGMAIRHMKKLGLQVGIVTNGSRMDAVRDVAGYLDFSDWVRLSLDSGTNETFVRMHKPKRKSLTLESICDGVGPVKKVNPDLPVGFSYVIVWDDCEATHGDGKTVSIVGNVDEMVVAAELAERSGFDYISFKPYLLRVGSNNAEIVELTRMGRQSNDIVDRIRGQFDIAKEVEEGSFRVIGSTNLRVLLDGTWMDYTSQPSDCHMTFLRQILSPFGVFNCPVYRNVDNALLGDKRAYSTPENIRTTQENTLKQIMEFDTERECAEVTCLYNPTNRFIEGLILHPENLDTLEPFSDRRDYFL